MARTYRKAKRAEAQQETRDRIVQATMALHVAQGVALTSYSDVAASAGVGAATVYRHFPTAELLIEACGAHFWEEIDPPQPEDAAAIFDGLAAPSARIERLAHELDAFYARAEKPLWSAVRDQDRFAPLQAFLARVRQGVTAMVAEALRIDRESSRAKIVAAVADFEIWRSLAGSGIGREEVLRLMRSMIGSAAASTES